ncbi:MAG: hypothetical protein ACI88H_001255, partial [Cocleimonas sp.]
MQFLKQFEERVSCRKLIQFPKTNSRITYGSGTTYPKSTLSPLPNGENRF